MQEHLSRQALEEARNRIRASIHRTPLLSSTLLGRRIGAPLHLKTENLQKTGSFKIRGALNKLTVMEEATRLRGVVTVSAGNHAQALAWAAQACGAPCSVVMPESAPRSKVAATRAYGAEVLLHGTVFDAFQRALELAEERQLTFVHPFDDEAIIAGQSSVGLEILEQHPDVTTIVVPVGGGGLISGIAVAVHRMQPGVRVIGVEPEGAAALRKSLDLGRAVRLEKVETIADGLGSPMAGEITFRYVQSLVEDIVVVSDQEIRSAMTLLLSRTKLLVEPAGAAGVAALLSGRIAVDGATISVLSGGNTDPEHLGRLLGGEESDTEPGESPDAGGA